MTFFSLSETLVDGLYVSKCSEAQSNHMKGFNCSQELYSNDSTTPRFVQLFDELQSHDHGDWKILDPSLSYTGSQSTLPHMALFGKVSLSPCEEIITYYKKLNSFLDIEF